MMKNAVFIVVIASLGMLFIYACSMPKHIKETPVKFGYDKGVIEQQLGLKEVVKDSTGNSGYGGALSDREQYLKEKYSLKLGVMPNEIENYALYDFIDQWLGTPFADRGFSEEGISPAYFVQVLYSTVYKTKLSKSPLGMFKSDNIERFTGGGFLREGDLVFLRYSKDDPISDVALYLQNDRILTSTPERGLEIFHFKSKYFCDRYVAGGRLKPKKEQNGTGTDKK